MKKYVLFLMATFALLGGLKAQNVEVEGKVESTDVQVGAARHHQAQRGGTHR